MRSFRWLIAAVLPLAVASIAAQPASAAVIDDFTTFQNPPSSTTNVVNVPLTVEPQGPGYHNVFTTATGSYTETIGGSNPLGGSRTVSATGITGAATASLDSTPGELSFNAGSGKADFNLTYDGAGISALGTDQIIEIEFETVNPPGANTSVDVTLTVNGGTNPVIQTIAELLTGNGPVTYQFDFGATLASLVGTVTSLEVNFPLTGPGLGDTAGDITISRISSSSIPTPEPASLAVWGMLGGIGLVARRRRRRNQRA